MITANCPDDCRKVIPIKKNDPIYPISGDEFAPDDEFSVQITAKSPSGENST
jgi:hypothetical protein